MAAPEELNACDMEVGEDGHMMDITEEADGQRDVEIAEALCQQEGGPVGKKYAVDLFTFAKPLAHYALLPEQVHHASTAGNLVVLTRTAHAASLVAGRCAGLEVFALCTGPSQHSISHGSELLENTLLSNHWPAARASADGVNNKRVRASSHNFAVVSSPAPSAQVFSRGRLRIIDNSCVCSHGHIVVPEASRRHVLGGAVAASSRARLDAYRPVTRGLPGAPWMRYFVTGSLGRVTGVSRGVARLSRCLSGSSRACPRVSWA